MENKKIVIPEEVVNPKAYFKFLALEKNPIFKNPIQITSEGDELNIGMLPHRLKKLIEHLSPKEQESILELKTRYQSIQMKKCIAKAMAFGRMGCRAGRTKEEYKLRNVTPYEEDVIELLGRMFTIAEVVRIMGEDNGAQITEDEVKGVLKRHIVEIERKREEFRDKVADVRLYNKRPRLDELSWMYSKMRARYVALNSVDAYNCMLRTLEQIRKESEGDVLNIKGAIDVNIEVEIQQHIQKEIFKTINLKEIILGRVSARMNYDPKKLVAGLHNSYYAKFVGISGDFDPTATMEYPSGMQYDFDKIESSSNATVIDVTPEPITETESASANRIKDLFLSKIKKQKEDLEKRKAGFSAQEEMKREEVSEDFDEVVRGKGRGKDKLPPSKSKMKAKKK